MSNPELEKRATEVAKRICRDAGIDEGLWQMVLHEAYRELYDLPVPTESKP